MGGGGMETHPVCDALQEAGAVAEALGGQTDPLSGSVAREAHHVLLRVTPQARAHESIWATQRNEKA